MSDKHSTADLLEEGGDYESKGNRLCVGGFPKGPCICLIVLGVLGVLVAILFPTMFMGVAPQLTQTAVSQTQLYVANATIIQWLYPIKDRFNVNPCEAYFPAHLTILQDIRFSNIPSFASLAPAYIMPTTATISFQGKEFGKLTLPMIDLSHPENGVKWANNTLCYMEITDSETFLKANEDVLPFVGRGWTIWHQTGEIVMKQDMAGIITYQGAVMDQDVNLTEPTFLDGPMVDNDFFESLMCIDEQKKVWHPEEAAADASAAAAAATTEAAAETTEAAAATTEAAAATTEAAAATTEAAAETTAAAKPTSSAAAASSSKAPATSAAKPTSSAAAAST